MKKLEALSKDGLWWDAFEEVDEETFKKYIKEYGKEYDYETDYYMGWKDYYDFNLSTGKYKIGTWEYTHECKIARIYWEYEVRFYLRKDR